MQNHYEINVSYRGRHLFATAERSATDKGTAEMLFNLLRAKFPKEKEYEVTCTYWSGQGQQVEF